MNVSTYALNVRSRTALTCELKPFKVPFLSTDDPQFSWLKYQISKHFKESLTIIDVRPGVYEKSEKQKNIYIITNLKRAQKSLYSLS